MLQENKKLEKLLRIGRRMIPKSVFRVLQPIYHWGLSVLGAIMYRFPSRSIKVIGVTGTHGKSTTVYMITQAFLTAGLPVAAMSSLEIRIKDKSWSNSLKMTMPGRFRIQKFLSEARSAGCKYVILEVTSEGIKQLRHVGINFDCVVFTNLAPEHIEHHGSFGKYMIAKQKLFKVVKNIQVLNQDDEHFADFNKFQANRKILFGLHDGEMNQEQLNFNLKLVGEFNIYNALAAISVAKAYDLNLQTAKNTIESIESVPGRMEFIQNNPFGVVVDYAHTPHAMEAVYKELKPKDGKLICVFGGTGGGRDKWKRPVFGEIAGKYCDQIFLTNDDPYDENPESIIEEIKAGINTKDKTKVVIDRKEAITKAIETARHGDCVVITGKGSEDRLVLAGGKKIPWSDKEITIEAIRNLED